MRICCGDCPQSDAIKSNIRARGFYGISTVGMTVPLLSLGAGTFGGTGRFFGAWGSNDVAEARRMVDLCLDAGVILFVTADVYSQGNSETVLGEALKGKALISTKATFRFGDDPNDVGSSRFHLLKTCEEFAEATADGLHRYFPAPRLRCFEAAGRGSLHSRPTGSPR